MASGVYRIVSSCGRQYIGSAMNLHARAKEHWRDLKRGKHHSRFMQRIWNKRGPDALRFDVLLRCRREHLIWYEQRAIDVYKPELNTAPTAGSQLGLRMSAESKLKMAAAARRTRNFTGHKHSEETKQRIAAKKRGRVNGPPSPETRAKIGAAHKGRVFSPEYRARISKTLTGTSTGRGSLNVDQVREIRHMRLMFAWGRFRIARFLGVKPAAVTAVIGNHAYGWVT